MEHVSGYARFVFALVALCFFVSPGCAEPVPAEQSGLVLASRQASVDDMFGLLLSQVQGVSDVESLPSDDDQFRIYSFNLEQPVFHGRNDSETFKQRLTLVYKSPLAPTVIGTLGYEIVDFFGYSSLAAGFGANELLIEHRYYGSSVPESNDHEGLRIKQAAADVHLAVERLRPLLLGSWISAGASKGAMLALQHRRLYPFDTQATIAFAPPTSFGRLDRRYRSFLDNVGTPTCRAKILEYQELMLENKDALIAEIEASPIYEGVTYELMPGGIGELFERSVHEVEFSLWHLFGNEIAADDCAHIPQVDDDLTTMATFYPFYLTFMLSTDDNVRLFSSYYVQKELELGTPGFLRPELASKFSVNVESITPYLMGKELPPFDPAPMVDNYFWTSVAMNRVIMIHGELDPYSARAVELSTPRVGEAYHLTVPDGSHLVGLEDLPEPSRQTVFNAFERWTGARWNPMSLGLLSDRGFDPFRGDAAKKLR